VNTFFKKFILVLCASFSVNAMCGEFFLAFPLGIQTVKSLEVNVALESEGIQKITDASSSNYSGGIGYEWDSGFRFALKGGQVLVVDEFESTVFASYSIAKGGLNIELPLVESGWHSFDLGFTLGGALSRFTLIGGTYSGVAQKLDGFFEPILGYKYGGKSVKFFVDLAYASPIEGEFKSFGTPGVSSLSGPGASVVCGLLVYL
jgi:hypothetical protein